MKKKAIVLGIGILTLGILLCACHPGRGFGNKPAPGSSQTAGASSSAKEKGDSSEKKEEDKKQEDQKQEEQKQEVQGIINKIGSYLVLLVGDGEYQVMDFGEGVTTDGFEEGDQVKITYTGTLGDEEHTPVIVTMEKID